jgi:hypothetical protein
MVVGRHLVVLCAKCRAKPDAEVRAAEVVREDWKPLPHSIQ